MLVRDFPSKFRKFLEKFVRRALNSISKNSDVENSHSNIHFLRQHRNEFVPVCIAIVCFIRFMIWKISRVSLSINE